ACADAEALLADVAPPPPRIAATVAKLRGELERARIGIAAGRPAEARVTAATVVAAARALDYPPLLAESLLVLGHATMLIERPQAVPILGEASSVALRAGTDTYAVEAWARRAFAQGTSGDPAAAIGGVDIVEALAARLPKARFAAALLYNNVGVVQLARER